MEKISKKLIDALLYLEDNPTESLTSIGKKFSVDRHSLARHRDLKDYKKFISSEAIEGANEEYLYYFTPSQWEAINNYTDCLVEGYKSFSQKYEGLPARKERFDAWLEAIGKEPQKKERKTYNYNRTAFNKIETEEDAYWLGFIIADGCIVSNNRLSINLAEKDRKHLEKFCKYLGMSKEETQNILKDGFGGAYTRDNPIVRLNICSTEIVKNLENKGVTAKKSGKEKPYLCNGNIELQKHFIRGIIDGDGFIRQTQYGMGVVGSLEMCEYIKYFICNNIKDVSTNHIREHGIIYKLEINGKNQVSKILKYFYEDANIYLDRKYNLYKTLYCRD